MATGRTFTGTRMGVLQSCVVLLFICSSAEAIFTLPGLEYTYDHLECDIDGRTMMLHVNEHHANNVGELNKALLKHPELHPLDLVTLNRHVGTDKIPADIASVIRNHGGGHFNHDLFFKTLGRASNDTGPSLELQFGIDDALGSWDRAKAQFNAAAMGVVGSGWAWFIQKPDGNLSVTSTPNNDNPLQAAVVEQPGTPILGLDMWEHSYYLKHQHRRQEYINAWWKVIKWDAVNLNYQRAKSEVSLDFADIWTRALCAQDASMTAGCCLKQPPGKPALIFS